MRLPLDAFRRIRRTVVAVALVAALAGCQTLPPPPSPAVPGAVAEPEEPLEPSPGLPAPLIESDTTDRDDPRPRIANGQALFERLAASFSPPICVRGDHNSHWRRRYASHPASFERQLRDALPLMAYVVEAVEARGLPGEFALIPIVESGYRPDARGPGGPTGLWQMIGSTARNHGVQVNREYDGRLSPVDATNGALDYLAALHAEFGDWRATAMAYNAGEGRLRRALARDGSGRVSGERRLPAGLSNITYAYVAKMHALACLVAEPTRHGLTLPTDGFVPLEVHRAPDGARRLDDVARAWGTTTETLSRWNPAYRQRIGNAGVPRRLLAPVGAMAADGALAVPPGDEATAAETRQHTVLSGDTLWRIARRYGTSVRALAAANGLDADRPLRIGRTLRIPD